MLFKRFVVMARWDAKNLEIRTRSVEQALVPLVAQVYYLNSLIFYHSFHANKS